MSFTLDENFFTIEFHSKFIFLERLEHYWVFFSPLARFHIKIAIQIKTNVEVKLRPEFYR